MRVSCRKTGGIANLKVSVEIDSEQLSPAEQRKMKELVDRAKLFDLPAKPGSGSKPDQFQYEITIEDQGRRHSFVTNDSAASDDLLSLVNWMISSARKPKESGN